MAIRKDILGRGWAFPFRFDAATGQVGLTSAEDNIRENITIILGTKPGERQMMPEFGCRIHELLFAPNTQATGHMAQLYVREALDRWEPRIKVLSVKSRSDPSGAVHVDVQYRITSMGSVHTVAQVVAPVQTR
jgi:uncharacterized protein